MLFSPIVMAQEVTEDFSAWLELLREDARSAGISEKTLDAALADLVAPEPRVIELDQKQPEKTESVEDYVAARVSPERIAEGRLMLQRYSTWLGRVERTYKVQRRFIVALWGIESSYGRHTGKHPVIPALVTLAYDPRRGDYFRKELLAALKILDEGHVSLSRMKGSWAGAMGPFQFMPSSYRHYAVDADGDGRINIWGSVPDALASAANYLAKAGWKNDQTWGRAVKLTQKLDSSLTGLETRLPLSRWQALGVRRSNGRALPRRDLQASLIIPDGPTGPAYLVYNNFRALRRWNRSNAFAVAVGTLAESYAENRR
ncbi:MAG: lytic murein transglycosylase [Desulfuromonadales bacterium]|nr:lytic murein transglycosylase [Desulfuromonadales bacterium]MDH3807622.1 lytic murein transglycosylase [Desulfuromonadales bacterium]MDH3868434.1 lytic murein transglycosylase [Desulfuromonadales bacterium]MDH3960658.1 lytic murein transglycosylase [Desulfuromonadales bacterium]MDH4024851.1 lytic murein transglycosylase [Desulfuromonadales bacterium]